MSASSCHAAVAQPIRVGSKILRRHCNHRPNSSKTILKANNLWPYPRRAACREFLDNLNAWLKTPILSYRETPDNLIDFIRRGFYNILSLGKIRPRFGSHAKHSLPNTTPDSPRDRSLTLPYPSRSPKPTMLGRLRLLSGEIPDPHTLMFIYLLLHLFLDLTPSPPPPGPYYGLSSGALNSLIKIAGCWIGCTLLIRARILEPKFISRCMFIPREIRAPAPIPALPLPHTPPIAAPSAIGRARTPRGI
jgi:hypothetical protein